MKVRSYAPVVLLPIVLRLAKSVHFAQKGRILLMVIESLQNNAGKYYPVIHVRKLILRLRLISLATVSLILSLSINAQPDTLLIAQDIKAGSYYLLKPESKKNDMDSADYFFNQALALSRSIGSAKWINTALAWKGKHFIEANKMDSGRFYFQKAIDGYHSKNYLVEEAAAWLQWGTCTPPFDSHFAPEKAKYFEHAYQLYWKLGDSVNALESLKAAADAHLYEPNLDIAEKELLTVAANYKAMHFRDIHFTYDLLRAVGELKGDLVKEVLYTMEMVRSLDSADIKNYNDSVLIGRLYCSAAVLYARISMWDRALLLTRKGWKTMQITESDNEYFSTAANLCSDLVRNDSSQEALRFILAATEQRQPSTPFQEAKIAAVLGFCYRSTGEIKKAELQFLIATRMLDSDKLWEQDIGQVQWEQEMILTMGNFFLFTHKYGKANLYAKRLPTNYNYLTTLGQRARIELFKSRVDSAMGRYHSALKHFATYQFMNDSLFGIQKTVQIQELQMRYALDKKDNDIRLQGANIKLLTKENELQQTQAGKSRNLRNMMAIALLFLILLAGMFYNRYRVKQQRNRQLELKQDEITAKNQQLEQLLQENEWLLQEVHHRVKNNLQTVTSLLTSQMESAEKGPAVDAIRESRQRIEAIAMIHQRLYNSNNYSSIMMPAYVADLVENLREAFNPGPRIVFLLFIEPIALDISAALPAALILNEAISNAMKHAFPGEMQGTITVRVNLVSQNKVMLEVGDDGIGFSEKTVINSKTFGIRLIKGLVSDVSGESQILNGSGTIVRVIFSTDGLP